MSPAAAVNPPMDRLERMSTMSVEAPERADEPPPPLAPDV